MLFLLSIFLILLLSLTVAVWASTRFAQGLFYSEPVAGLSWRAPAVAAALTAWLALWAGLDYLMFEPDQRALPYDTLFRFKPEEVQYVRRFWSVQGGEEVLYTRRTSANPGGDDFVNALGDSWHRSGPFGNVQAILIEDAGGRKSRFVAEMASDGKFRSTSAFPTWYEENGRRRMESLGRVGIFHRSSFLMNMLLNLGHAALWFGAFWYLLQYQWPHALGLAVAVWAAFTFAVVPPLLDEAVAARRRAIAKPTAARVDRGPAHAAISYNDS